MNMKTKFPVLTGNVFFKHIEFDAQLLRAIAKACHGGADFGECIATAYVIEEGNHDSWYDAWNAMADRIYAVAESCDKQSHRISAYNAYLRSSEYYRQAQWFLRDNLQDERVITLADRIQKSFRQAMQHSDYQIEAVRIPYIAEHFLRGYFLQSNQNQDAKGTVLILSGYDSYVEELFFSAVEVLKRGYHVLMFDGPGQGQTLIREKLFMRYDWENVIPFVLNYVCNKSVVNSSKVILLGRSFGSYLATRSASIDFPFAALIADPGHYDLYATIKEQIPAEILHKIEQHQESSALHDFIKKIDDNPITSYFYKWRMAAHGTQDICEWFRHMQNFNVRSQAKNIVCPTLVCNAVGENKNPGQAELLLNAIKSRYKELITFTAEEGAGDHCELGTPLLFAQRVYDWLDEVMSSNLRPM